MPDSKIPALNRRYTRPVYYLNIALAYLTTIPLHWLMTRFGSRLGMLPLMNSLSEGKNGGTNAFASYTPSGDDVFICTYAKSGTNWMMQLAHQIVFRGAGEYGHIHDVIPWPDMQIVKSIALESTVVQDLSPEHKRVIKTHLAADHVPYAADAHYVTVIRDPKEVFVSSYHFCKGTYGPFMPDFDTWLDSFLSDDFPMGTHSSWAEHTASFWAMQDRENVQILLYQDMKNDFSAVAAQVAGFLGVELEDAEMSAVVEKCSFSYMKQIDDKFLAMPKENAPWAKQIRMMREGKSGNSSELLSPEQQARIDRHFREALLTLESDFPYDDCFVQGKDS